VAGNPEPRARRWQQVGVIQIMEPSMCVFVFRTIRVAQLASFLERLTEEMQSNLAHPVFANTGRS
jgi:hypothetical protein